MKRFLQDEIVRDIVGSAAAHQELEAEYSQLEKDRDVLRSIFPSGNNKVIFQSIDTVLNKCIFHHLLYCRARNSGLPMTKGRPYFRNGRREKMTCQVKNKMAGEILQNKIGFRWLRT